MGDAFPNISNLPPSFDKFCTYFCGYGISQGISLYSIGYGMFKNHQNSENLV